MRDSLLPRSVGALTQAAGAGLGRLPNMGHMDNNYVRAGLARALCLVLITGCAGCQTFSLTEDQFARQQRGECADPEVGAAVGVAGTLGYMGAMVGAAAARVK